MNFKNFIPVTFLIASTLLYAEQPSLTLEQYRKSIEYRLSGFDDHNKKMDQFKKEKRSLTSQEVIDDACSTRDFYKSAASYINQYPEYKIQSNNYKFKNGSNVYQLESAYFMYKDLITTNNIKCNEDTFVPPPYAYSLLRWKELPKLTGEGNLTLKYIDSENIGIVTFKPLVKSVNIRELYKKYPNDIYFEFDYIIYCDSKEYSLTRLHTYRNIKGDPPINYEMKYPLPHKIEPIAGTMTPIYEFTCK